MNIAKPNKAYSPCRLLSKTLSLCIKTELETKSLKDFKNELKPNKTIIRTCS
jgi:hypothetical protein